MSIFVKIFGETTKSFKKHKYSYKGAARNIIKALEAPQPRAMLSHQHRKCAMFSHRSTPPLSLQGFYDRDPIFSIGSSSIVIGVLSIQCDAGAAGAALVLPWALLSEGFMGVIPKLRSW